MSAEDVQELKERVEAFEAQLDPGDDDAVLATANFLRALDDLENRV